MEAMINLRINPEPQVPRPSIAANNTNLKTLSNNINLEASSNNVIKNSIIGNNPTMHITFNKTIEYNEVYSYIERKVIDMENMELQTEINKILRKQANTYVILGGISAMIVLLSFIFEIVSREVGLVLKPLSVAFSLMIGLHYIFGRAK